MAIPTIKEFIINDVRCFAGEQRARIAPLTFLVGENSAGKSTFLGCYNALMGGLSKNYWHSADFNVPPYEMGAFSDIARRKKGAFQLGCRLQKKKGEEITVRYDYSGAGGQTTVSKIQCAVDSGSLTLFFTDKESERITKKGDDYSLELPDRGSRNLPRILKELPELYYYLREAPLPQLARPAAKKRETNLPQEVDEFIRQHLSDIQAKASINIAPIRFKPKRTYDPLTEEESPEGDDVPMYLMRLKLLKSGIEKELYEELAKFGKASGLFDGIKVKTFGGINEPFQLQAKVRGGTVNLIDAGYGISQLLPILVRMFVTREKTLLLQQPEVNLHPRAQAELSSACIAAIKERKHNFIVETHSDYMIDRTSIEIRKGKIAPEDVSLVYFRALKDKAQIYNIGYDKQGNLINVPDEYRKFFNNESRRFLGFDD